MIPPTVRRSHPWLIFGLAGVLLVAIVFGFCIGAGWFQTITQRVKSPAAAVAEIKSAPSAEPQARTAPEPASLIAYIGKDGNIYTTTPDGTGRTQVTRDASDDPTGRVLYQGLSWSPDGTYLAFTCISPDPSAAPPVYVPTAYINQPESGELRPLNLQGKFTSLIWMADSSGLFYDREIAWDDQGKPTDPMYGVWKYDLKTGQSQEVVSPAHHFPLALRSVSPNGRYITFDEILYPDGPGFFGTFDLQTQVYRSWDQKGDLQPGSVDWSPDDQSLIFDKIVYGVRLGSQIWKADPAFERIVALTPSQSEFSTFIPRYAPTGDQIAYLSEQGHFTNPTELWVMNGDGSSQHRAATCAGLTSITWSPDGKQLAYACKQQGKLYNVMVVDSAGGQSRFIAEGSQPEWRP